MNKSYQTAARTHSRRFVDKPCSFVLQFRERDIDVRYLDRDMVHSRSAFSEKLSHGGFWPEWFEQLDVSITHGQHAHPYALLGDVFGRIHFQAKCIAPDGQTLFDAICCDSDVINFEQPE